VLLKLKLRPALYNRQKVLVALLRAFGGTLQNVDMQKYLFLFTEQCESEASYEFVPYRFGCFSFQSYADRRKLIEFGLLANHDGWHLIDDEEKLPNSLVKKTTLFAEKYASLRGDDLVRRVYRDYPYYATRSEIAGRLMSNSELAAIESARSKECEPTLFTIGYEGQSFENYLNRLLRNNVALLCDVRKNPLSRKYGFSKKALSETLSKLDIEYIHIPELGIVSDKRRSLKTRADYQSLFAEYEATTLQSEGDALNHLVELLSKYNRVAITCFEADYCMCHRGKVAEHVAARPNWPYRILHI
jgi:hypothetical protein|tara:strand:- start:276 stop:1181 length:906 start_codon:yes stop_codon:yes gene_type:complete